LCSISSCFPGSTRGHKAENSDFLAQSKKACWPWLSAQKGRMSLLTPGEHFKGHACPPARPIALYLTAKNSSWASQRLGRLREGTKRHWTGLWLQGSPVLGVADLPALNSPQWEAQVTWRGSSSPAKWINFPPQPLC
jgi:hypothetical protein